MSSPKDEEKSHDETRDHGDGDNDEVRHAPRLPAQLRRHLEKEQKSTRGG